MTGHTQFKMRLADNGREKLERAAAKSGRSLNAEAVHRLELSFAKEEWLAELSAPTEFKASFQVGTDQANPYWQGG